jgi:Fur family transcriptional regulator, ferric uptake regulator
MTLQTIHRQEKEQFVKLFKQDRIDRFEDRVSILEVFLKTENHVTLDELVNLVQRNGYGLSADFIRETLDLMCHYGFAQQNQFNNGHPRYEHRHLGQHHDHMICTKCKKIVEFEDQAVERLQLKIASEFGFHLLQHKMELYGICRRCLHRRDLPISLDASKSGERLVIRGFSGGTRSKLRLLTMGLRVGDAIEVITNVTHGQLVIAVDFKRLVLGRGLAKKILVSPFDGSNGIERQPGSGRE